MWKYNINALRKKCPMSCLKISKPGNCIGHGESAHQIIKKEFEDHAKKMIQNCNHKNLVRYLDVSCHLCQDELTIFLVQEYVKGKSIELLCGQNMFPNISFVARSILDCIDCLNGMDVNHGYLKEKSIFLDETAVCRIADFDLIPYLMYLGGNHNMHEESDIHALGLLVESQNEFIKRYTKNFIDQCQSGKVLTHEQLLNHSFVSNSWIKSSKSVKKNIMVENFIIEKKLGSGAFGVVLQAKNKLNKKVYALKFIKCNSYKKEQEQIDREAVIHSKLKHKNIVCSVTSWKQSINLSELLNDINDDGFMEDDLSGDESSSIDSEFSLK